MISHVSRVSLAARLILVSLCRAVSLEGETRLTPRWADGNEESSIKVSGVERFYDSKEECVCGGGDGGIYFTRNYPHTAKTRNSMRKKDMPGVPQDQQRPLRRFQENKIPNTYISVLFYSVQISFV